MTVARGFRIILGSGTALGAAGAGLGYLLGRHAPAYYRSVFAGGDSPGFDPVQVGFGLGLTQGLIAGHIVGSVVVLAVAASEFRRSGKGPFDLA